VILREKLRALATLAAVKKDADLGRLAAVSARLVVATRARDDMVAALARETAFATATPEVPVWQALDAHVILAERARGALEAQIGRIAAEREAMRGVCALSFGRAEVLGRLQERAARQARSARA